MINFNENYFADKEFKEMSPAAIMYMQLIKPAMMEEIYRQAQKSGYHLEAFIPESIEVAKLLDALRKSIYANDVVLRSEVLKHEQVLVHELLTKFITSGNDNFIDHALFILAFTKVDIVKELIRQLPNFKYPYTQSVACLVLGAKGDDACIEILDHYYHHFRANYPSENFDQGALFGLKLLFDRRSADHDHEHEDGHTHHEDHIHTEHCNH